MFAKTASVSESDFDNHFQQASLRKRHRPRSPLLVCHCTCLTDRDIKESIRDGAHTVEAVAATCGAGGCCGGCRPTIERLLRIERSRPSACPAESAPRSAA